LQNTLTYSTVKNKDDFVAESMFLEEVGKQAQSRETNLRNVPSVHRSRSQLF